MPAIIKDLGLTNSEAGRLFFVISLGYFVALLGSGFFSSRFFHRKTIIISATTVGLALELISFSKNLWEVRSGLLLLGMAAGLYLPSGIATLTSLISPRHWGKAIAVHELAPNLGFVAAPLASEALLLWFSWRGVLMILGAISLMIGMAFACFGRGGEFPGQTPNFTAIKTLFVEPSFWIMMALFSLAIAGSLGIYTMLPLYLVAERGIDRNRANTLIALSRISGLGMSFVSGWMSDKVGMRFTMAGVLLVTGLMTVLLGIFPAPWVVLFVFIQPLVAVCFFPPGFAALSSIGPAESRNVAVSLAIPVAFIFGGGAIPAGIGFMGDAASFASGISAAGGVILIGFVLSWYLKFPKRSQNSFC